MYALVYLIAFSTLAVAAPHFAPLTPLRVDLGYGAFTGKYVAPFVLDGVLVRAHLGIPFAAPPTGPLRFRPPQPVPHVGEMHTTYLRPNCFQNNSITTLDLTGRSEDCLYLNVWSPARQPANEPLPVMVWIFGGGFYSGGAGVPFYDGATMTRRAMDSTPVIVVTINYRVGPLGFMASSDLQEEGSLNPGLLDQRAALQWVRQHIKAFGGDPDNVTVFGESAGAISIASHLTAASNVAAQRADASGKSPLFDRAILESGAATVAAVGDLQKNYDAVLSYVGCNNATTSAARLACLRAADPAAITTGASQNFGIVVDGTYVVEPPLAALSKGDYLKVPILLGDNTNEGTFFEMSVKTAADFDVFMSRFGDSVTKVQELYPLSAYKESYFETASAIFADNVFKCQVRHLADTYSTSLPVYRYHWNHAPILVHLVDSPLGVFHGSEYFFVFGWPFIETPLSGESQLSQIVIDYWTAFAYGGQPKSKFTGVEWPLYVANESLPNGGGERIRFDSGNKGGVVTELDLGDNDKCAFWVDYQRRRF
ncbi:hypothetical protein HK101_000447 [Irineochytrium annulatum]|nr:hypothetical protein HK101_000447 [Irineochytrium annulatum]